MTNVLKEAERLYNLGFAILWIKPKSKAPVKSKWTSGPRDSWESLKSSYKQGYNLGVRLGSPSKVGDLYLAVIDIDVKSEDPKHQYEAENAVRELFPHLSENVIKVMSGRGNGSSHIYIGTKEPAQAMKFKVSKDRVKVLMPSASISKAQVDQLSEEDLNEGFRMRPAWEISVMSEGQQTVLPPSTHPDTRREYVWKTRIERPSDLVLVELKGKKKELKRSETFDWAPEEVDLLDPRLSEEIVNIIIDGDVDDRSAALFKVAIAMVKGEFTDRQIMTVLTDTNYELGRVAYEHVNDESREKAANWVYNYTVKKARLEFDAKFQFNEEVEVTESLSDEEAQRQIIELQSEDWRTQIERNGPKGQNANKPKATLKNIILILTNEIAGDVFLRNVFKNREVYGHSTPWGGTKGDLLVDDDVNKIRVWLASRYRFEPAKDLIHDVMSYLAERNSFDPVKDWLETLEWDGTLRLDTWLKNHFEAEGDPEYLAQVFTKWMTAMVMRVYRPGAKFDWMPILEGHQGYGKSSFGEILVGPEYFLDKLPDLHDKDAALALQGIWICEHGELSTLRKNEIEIFKAFTTRTIDKVRPPFGKRWIESPRRCVFFGTTNKDTYLSDDSGNRRFKPVKVGRLDFEALKRDREQIFAEAVFIFKNCFDSGLFLELDGNAKIYEAKVQSEKMIEDESTFMIEKIAEWLMREKKKSGDEAFPLVRFKNTWLFDSARGGPLSDSRGDQRNLNFAAKALKKLGATFIVSGGNKYYSFPGVGVYPYHQNHRMEEKLHEISIT